MTVSLDGDRIPRKKGKKKLSETLITGNKITQYPDNLSKKARVVSSIEGTKIPSIKPKEDQINDAIGNLKTDEQKSIIFIF